MRVHVYPADSGGCGYYRLIWAAEAAIQEGYDVQLFMPTDPAARFNVLAVDNDDGSTQVLGLDRPDCDVVVVQRPLRQTMAEAIPLLQRQGIRVVVEVDDDFDAIHPKNVAWRGAQSFHNRNTNRSWLRQSCVVADRVTVSTPALQRRYRQDAVLVPNMIPARYLNITKHWSNPVRVGWSGSIDTHPNDLAQMGALFPTLANRGHDIAVVGTGRGVAAKSGLRVNHSILVSGWVPLDEYPDRMSELDVGVVPLELSVFNQAKSWLKGLEFAAVGVPFVASPTQSYMALHKLGIGRLAHDRKDWKRETLAVIEERRTLGQQYRDIVVQNDLTIEGRLDSWIDAWTKW